MIENANKKYVSVDICNDFQRLPEIVESIYLDNEYHYETWSKKFNKTMVLSNVIAIYAEVPPEMMNYLKASFANDVRFLGDYTSFNSSLDQGHFEKYATIFHYIITSRFQWHCLFILNVKPSIKTPLYKLMIEKSKESKMCFKHKEIDHSWRMHHENNHTVEWFKTNKPVVITVGEQYGQVEVIKHLSKLRNTGYTFPILAEGLLQSFEKYSNAPDNFDCLQHMTSSFVSTVYGPFYTMNNYALGDQYIIEKISRITNRTMLFSQTFAISQSSKFDLMLKNKRWLCQCSLDYDCVKENIQKGMNDRKESLDLILTPSPSKYNAKVMIMDEKYKFNVAKYRIWQAYGFNRCRWYHECIQSFQDVLASGKGAANNNTINDEDDDGDSYCWNSKLF